MTSCGGSDNNATLPDSPCICCCPPDFVPDETTVDSTRNDNLFESRIDMLNEYFVQGFILRRMTNTQPNKELFIYHVDPAVDPVTTLKTRTDRFTGEQFIAKHTSCKTKKYKICLTCASLPDLKTKLRDIFYIPMSNQVRKEQD